MKNKIEEIFNEYFQKKQEYGNVDEVAIKALNVIFPDFIPVEKYNDTIFTVRILEKLSRIASSNISDDKKTDAYQDIIGYSLLGFDKLSNNDKNNQ